MRLIRSRPTERRVYLTCIGRCALLRTPFNDTISGQIPQKLECKRVRFSHRCFPAKSIRRSIGWTEKRAWTQIASRLFLTKTIKTGLLPIIKKPPSGRLETEEQLRKRAPAWKGLLKWNFEVLLSKFHKDFINSSTFLKSRTVIDWRIAQAYFW